MSRALSRLAALGLALAVLAAVGLGLIAPLAAHRAALDAEAEALAGQLAALTERLATTAPPARMVVDEPALIEGPSPERAAAALQARLSRSVAAAGGDLRRIRLGRPSPIGADPATAVPAAEAIAMAVPVEIEFDTTVTGMKRFLHDIEAQRPYLVVRALDARRLSRGRDEPRAEARVALRIEVVGFANVPGDA